ncbi:MULTISPECIES: hypothetical protein [Nocardiopsis]|uniref:Uncharacterized protein n=1 Tax=Nocardiopsis sinuspersici TaxID=501010 RepID=A0A1V3C0V6_9ACTN|nr:MULTISPECIES: hypothetical protein [Nocardiopsis]OOC54293.1 hypothetical protein NOSIN_11160 [Nocardiopsis sinuspersici]
MLRELFMSLIHTLFGPPPGKGRPNHHDVVEERLAFTARLPTSSQGLWFDASFDLVVVWYRAAGSEHARDRAVLQGALIREAARRSTDFALGDHGRAQAEVSCALTEGGGFGVRTIHDLGVGVALTAHEEDLALERQRQLVWHRAEVAREEHRVRMRRVQELREEVLHDPLVARVWWFEQHQERWNEIAVAGAALDLLSPCQVSGSDTGHAWPGGTTSAEEPEEDPVLDAFLSGLEGHEKAAVLQRLTDILEAFERRDLAQRLREQWPQS